MLIAHPYVWLPVLGQIERSNLLRLLNLPSVVINMNMMIIVWVKEEKIIWGKIHKKEISKMKYRIKTFLLYTDADHYHQYDQIQNQPVSFHFCLKPVRQFFHLWSLLFLCCSLYLALSSFMWGPYASLSISQYCHHSCYYCHHLIFPPRQLSH